jgi:hypothetical protein
MRNKSSVPQEATPVALKMGVRKACIAVVSKKTINQCVDCLLHIICTKTVRGLLFHIGYHSSSSIGDKK